MVNYGYKVLLDVAPARPIDYVEVMFDDIIEFLGIPIAVGVIVITSIILIVKAVKKNKNNEE